MRKPQRLADKRRYNRILVLAVEAAERQASPRRVMDRNWWVVARWSAKVPHVCKNERETKNCTDRWPREPRRWCRTCVHAAQLVAAYEGIAPPSWRVPTPDRASGPVVVRVHVDGAPAGQAVPGQAQTPRLTKDGRCRFCRGVGTVKFPSGRHGVCDACDGTGGRRCSR